ncbi:hypothetical protein ElyMa_005188000 [Elysia marginata]|uniref:Uncharacterized protein n=1 Tax=Elysia marginata TaxID=1093978 RepID=A0AAV4JW57_9GAST|nr:hypothetical protein ElyMa_005188000 [Elysia marginata]
MSSLNQSSRDKFVHQSRCGRPNIASGVQHLKRMIETMTKHGAVRIRHPDQHSRMNVVNGDVPPADSPDPVLKLTCTHTRATDTTGRWMLSFRRSILPTSFVIHNRVNRDRDGKIYITDLCF